MLLEKYLKLTAEDPAPEIFRLWSALTLISGVAARRVCYYPGNFVVYPNIFVLLVSPPGVGKSNAIVRCRKLWLDAGCRVAPVDMNRAAMVDIMKVKHVNENGVVDLDEFSSLCVATAEINVLFPQYDTALMAVLCYMYDNEDMFEERRRARTVQVIKIGKPHLTTIFGMPTGAASSIFPDHAWETGYASRTHIIYSDEVDNSSIFKKRNQHPGLYEEIVVGLRELRLMEGEMFFSKDAQKVFWQWADCSEDENGNIIGNAHKPEPKHPKFKSYTSRRRIHCIKISMIIALASLRYEVQGEDVVQALLWLEMAEKRADKAIPAMLKVKGADVLESILAAIPNDGASPQQLRDIIAQLAPANEYNAIAAHLENSTRLKLRNKLYFRAR